MTGKECLESAEQCALRNRAQAHASPEKSFPLISDLWTAYTGVKLTPLDVAVMLGLLKVARIKLEPGHAESYADLAAYAACAAEMGTMDRPCGTGEGGPFGHCPTAGKPGGGFRGTDGPSVLRSVLS